MVRKTNILLLDEATASVDGDYDAHLQEVLRREVRFLLLSSAKSFFFKFKNTTVVTIAHRLNTIEDYDRILVMDDGEVRRII